MSLGLSTSHRCSLHKNMVVSCCKNYHGEMEGWKFTWEKSRQQYIFSVLIKKTIITVLHRETIYKETLARSCLLNNLDNCAELRLTLGKLTVVDKCITSSTKSPTTLGTDSEVVTLCWSNKSSAVTLGWVLQAKHGEFNSFFSNTETGRRWW